MMNVKPFVVRVVVIAGFLCLGSAARLKATTANDLCAPAADPCRVTTRVMMVTDQSIIDVGARELRIENGGSLETALGVTAAGDMTLRAGRLTVMANGALLALGSASRNGGQIIVQAGEITIDGRVSATGGSGGEVSITGTGRVTVGGTLEARNFAADGEGGEIFVQGGTLTVTGPVIAHGGLSGFGGDVTLQATGDVTLSGDIDAEGGDGGTVELLAGIALGAGNITVTDDSLIDTDAAAPGGFGGSVDLDARGDGVNTGNVTMNGILLSNGGTGTDETTGGDGGSISITAEGTVITEDGSTMEVQGGRPDGFGGEIEVLTNQGDYSMDGTILVGPLGTDGSGGDLTIDVAGDLTFNGRLEGSGGSSLLIEASGSLFVEPRGAIDVSEGGELDLAAGTGLPNDVLGRIVVRGPLSAHGGTIDLAARDAVTLAAPVRADGVRLGGPGGTVQIIVDAGPALLNNLISARATGGNNMGGIVSVDAQGPVSVVGTVDVTGIGSVGGMVGLVSVTDTVDISGTISAGATGTGRGGSVEVVSAVELLVSGTIRVDGGQNGVGGGTIELNSCSINVRDSGLLSSTRPNGINRIIGRRETLFLGTMRADNQTGLNEFRYRTSQNQPLIFGSVQPDEVLVIDATLVPCVECGNGNPEPPEECDDGNQNDGDGCSRSCMIEQILVGDANGDLEVDAGDLDAVIAEIFDGDPSDSVADVGSPEGSFSGRPGADANENERIEAADLSAIVGIMFQ